MKLCRGDFPVVDVTQGGQFGRRYQSALLGAASQVQPSWFRGIPPERVGLNGEYDYYGLAKRVRCYLHERMGLIQSLKVAQRGRVIVLSGVMPSGEALHQLTQFVLCVPGVDAVEAHAVNIHADALVPVLGG
ncbi:MAG: hypothetical protein AAFZ80_00555 [Cyanobacteria bacterium P01_A01_bin.105]